MQNTVKAITIKNMQPTTPTKPSGFSNIRKHGAPRFLPMVLAALALFLLVLALPALGARLFQLKSHHVRQALLNEGRPAVQEIDTYILTRKRAVFLRPSGELMDELAMAYIARGQTNSALTTESTKEAVFWQTKSLERAPANAFGWARLSYLSFMGEGASSFASGALALSLETAPYEPALSVMRLNMAMTLYDNLSSEIRERIPSMIRFAWEHDPVKLGESAAQMRYVSVVEQILMDDQEALRIFRELLPIAVEGEAVKPISEETEAHTAT